jgi:ABC-type Zn uptake system ZnuABC Zn-binding protein ZnuA
VSRFTTLFSILLLSSLLAGCAQPVSVPATGGQPLKVMAVESFLADIAQNVAGERLKIDVLIPLGLDPHAFEPTPADVTRIAESQALIINGAGFEEWLEEIQQNTGSQQLVIEASAGLTPRTPQPGEHAEEAEEEHEEEQHEGDPHFWFDPRLVIKYVENIRDGLTKLDPAGQADYARNAEAYIAQLQALDAELEQQLASIPPERRLIVTNHESFGYFADRYGLRIVGTVLPGVTTGASPSAQQMAGLIDTIRQQHVPAIFLETGANPELAEQIAVDTGVKVVSDLYTHSLTTSDGPASSYLDMMRHNAAVIVEALK